MDDNDNKRNEIAATLFSVLLGIGFLLISTWSFLGKGCSKTPGTPTESKLIGAPQNEVKADDGVKQPGQTSLNKELTTEKEKLSALTRQMESLKAELKEQTTLKEQLASAKSEIDSLQKKLEGANAQIKAAETLTGAKTADLQKSIAENTQFKSRIAELQGKVEGLTSEKGSLTASVEKLKIDLDGVNKLMTSSSAQSASMISRLTADKDDQVSKLSLASNKISQDASERIKRLTMDNQGLVAEINQLKAAATRMTADSAGQIKKLTDDNQAFTAEIARLKEAATKLANDSGMQIKKLTTDNLRFADEIASLKLAATKMTADSAAQAKRRSDENKAAADEIAKMKAAAEKMTTDSSAQIKKLTADNQTFTNEITKLKEASTDMGKDFAERLKKLTADNQSFNAEISTLKAASTKMVGDSAAQINKLTTENKAAADEAAKMRAVGEKMKEDSAAQIKKLNEQNKELLEQLNKLKGNQAQMNEGSAVDQIRKLTADNQRLSAEISQLKGNASAPKMTTGPSVAAGVNAAAAKLKELAAKLKPAEDVPGLDFPSLIQDPAKLDEQMLPLFVELKNIEDDPDARSKTYVAINKRGRETPVMTVKFDTGSSSVGAGDIAALKNLPASGDAKFLVVGYSSTDGAADTNARLASKRASEVAQQIIGDSKQSDRVQAIYFGQTNRFSKAYRSPNRVVEVWRIEK